MMKLFRCVRSYGVGPDIPGLSLEGNTLEHLAGKLRGAILDLIEASGDAGGKFDMPVMLIAQANSLAGELSKKPF
jgi:hypothetical protein